MVYVINEDGNGPVFFRKGRGIGPRDGGGVVWGGYRKTQNLPRRGCVLPDFRNPQGRVVARLVQIGRS